MIYVYFDAVRMRGGRKTTKETEPDAVREDGGRDALSLFLVSL